MLSRASPSINSGWLTLGVSERYAGAGSRGKLNIIMRKSGVYKARKICYSVKRPLKTFQEAR